MRNILVVRRVVGRSMAPNLEPGQLVVATGWLRQVSPGQVIIVSHDDKEKIKRVERVDDSRRKIFVIGDNLQQSTDSRHFGWLNYNDIVARVIFPNSNLHKG